MGTILLFVYGTLKRGERNHGFLRGQEYLRPARTLPHYRLYNCGPYPGLVRDAKHGRVIDGELWRITEERLPILDSFEGVGVFRRGPVEVEGETEPVVAYFYELDVTGLGDCGAAWPPAEKT